ncbi:glucose 1-dehydrogenase [Microbacterium protaetiae]|uniref:Glucose 1-dehydrogenase n=2 Tax=Microbacterium protaetiae TaxID=2509458 RepID=A0A4P6EUJ8_9MICO|nr:glucose 1-dehydrogenase [Microbacterium protaetiae]
MSSLQGKVAVVTGAGAGLGRSIAIRLAARGARVVVADIADEAAAETARLIAEEAGEARAFHVDVTSSADSVALVAHAVLMYGRLDVAVNNAGVAPPPHPIAEVPADVWRRTLSVDLDGVFNGIQAQIPAMVEHGGGVIVNIASILGTVGFPGLAPYVAAKHAVIGLTKQIAVDYAKQGIRSIAIGPAFIKTGLEAVFDDATRKALDEAHPIGRMGTPGEVGEVVAAVAEDGWSFVNGAYLPIDGGYLSR